MVAEDVERCVCGDGEVLTVLGPDDSFGNDFYAADKAALPVVEDEGALPAYANEGAAVKPFRGKRRFN